jgi:hypothetical protein
VGLKHLRTKLCAFTVLAVLSGATAQAHNKDFKIAVFVYDDAGLDVSTILQAEEMAGQIYQQIGVAISWHNCSSKLGPRGSECLRRKGDELVIHVVQQSRSLAADVYGVAFLDEDGHGTYCDVFVRPIEELHRQSRSLESRILGVVTAHELGHLLLGSRAHSSWGLMRPQIQERNFSTLDLETAAFDRRQTRRILDRLSTHQDRQERDEAASAIK